MDIKEKVLKYISQAAAEVLQEKEVKVTAREAVVLYPSDPSHGDLASNVAFGISKALKISPQEAAEMIVNHLPKMPEIEKIQATSNGYVNLWLSQEFVAKELDLILKQKDKYGSNTAGKGKKVLTEFISANPTGPLTLANARWGFLGDALSRILEFSGYKVSREYYMNDSAYHNTQIQMLGRSVLAELSILPEEESKQYSGEYIKEVAGKVIKREPGLADGKDIFLAGTLAAEIIFKEFIMPTIARMGIEFSVITHENEFYEDGSVKRGADEWVKKKLAYEKDGALWFKTKEHGAEEDAVIRRSSGEFTYLAADIVHYLKNVKEGGYSKLINIVGADHHGTVKNLLAALKAFGVEEKVEVIIGQFVRLTSGGKEVKMSKRAGTFYTVDELLDETGPDVARFFFLLRSADTHMDFDLDLAREQSAKNPVFYVQYAHARVSGILRNAKSSPKSPDWSLLESAEERNLVRELIRFPEMVSDAGNRRNPQVLAHYAIKLADLFHPFYDTRRVIIDDKALSNARLALVEAVRITLANTLRLLGVNAPLEM